MWRSSDVMSCRIMHSDADYSVGIIVDPCIFICINTIGTLSLNKTSQFPSPKAGFQISPVLNNSLIFKVLKEPAAAYLSELSP